MAGDQAESTQNVTGSVLGSSVVKGLGSVDFLISVPVAMLLLVSGYIHLTNPYRFLSAVNDYDLLGKWAVVGLAMMLPFLHLSLGVGLLTTKAFRRPGLACTAILLGIYVLAQTITIARGLDISCGCFGAATPVSSRSLGFALTGSLLSAAGFWISRRHAV